MKKINLLFMAVIIMSLAASCGSSNIAAIYNESSVRLIEPKQNVLITPFLADLEIISENKIEPYEEIFPYLVTPTSVKELLPSVKIIALQNAAAKHNADVLVGAIMKVETTSDGTFKIIVTGYPAKWVNFRKATEKDAWMYDMMSLSREANPANLMPSK